MLHQREPIIIGLPGPAKAAGWETMQLEISLLRSRFLINFLESHNDEEMKEAA